MLVFMDGQAHYDTTRIGLKYTTVDQTTATWAVTSEGRFGNCLKRTSINVTGDGGYLGIAPLTTRLGPWVPTTGGVCGFAIKVDDLSDMAMNAFQNNTIFYVMEGSIWHVRVAVNADGTFSLIHNPNDMLGFPVIVAVSSEGLTNATWMFVEFKWVIAETVGTFQIRVNGVEVLSYTGTTVETGLANTLGLWNSVRLFAFTAEVPVQLVMRMCDLYLADLDSATADDVSDFLGDGIIETIMPNGVGATTDWTPSGTLNWDMVNDRPTPDDDGTYVRGTWPGTTDLYHYEDIPPGAIVKGVHVNILARKEEEGGSTVAPLVLQGGVEYAGTPQGVTSPTYDRFITQAWDLNPATGVKFTAAEINAGQFGVRKVI